MLCLTLCVNVTATPLSEEDVKALRVLFLSNGIKPGEISLESSFEKVQQLLHKKGHEQLASDLRPKLDEGMLPVM